MNAQIQIFNNPQLGEIRTAQTETGNPLFCLADVCKILELQTNKVKERLNVGGWNTIPVIDSLGRNQEATFISEPNLYKTIFQSRKPEAEAFTEWVTSEVLPSIRKNGGYIATKEDDTDESIMARAIIIATNTIDALTIKNKALESANTEKLKQIEQVNKKLIVANNRIQFNAPKVEFADRLTNTEKLFDLGRAAKVLQLPFGRNILFRKLKDEKILMKNNEPYQNYIDQGYFVHKFLGVINGVSKRTGLPFSVENFQSFVTGKGMFWLSKKYEGRNSFYKEISNGQLDLI